MPRLLKRRCSRTAMLLLAVLSVAPSLHAQEMAGDRPSSRQGFYLGVNMLVGGTSALVRSFFTDAHPAKAFVQGAMGGAVTYGGMRTVGTTRPELRFIGLQTTALGANIVRNAAHGVPALSDLTFPVFPLYVRVQWDEGKPKVGARLSVMNTGAIVAFALGARGEVDFDWKESLITGAPIFHADREQLICYAYSSYTPGRCLSSLDGVHGFGAVAYSEAGKDSAGFNLLTHEVGHLAQFIRDGIMHAVPASDLLLPKLDDFIRHHGATEWGTPFGDLSRYIVLDAVIPLKVLSARTGRIDWPYGRTFYEREADAMMGVDSCVRKRMRCSW